MDEAIKKRWITLIFPRDLSEKEESILIVNLQAIRDGTKDELRRTWEKLNRKRFEHLKFIPGLTQAVEFMKYRAASLAQGSADEFFSLGKTDKHTYHFGYAHDDLKTLNASISLIGRTLKLPEPAVLNDGSIIDGIKRYVLRDMGFSADQVTITVSDKEPGGV
jgi:hypothetical protein